MDSFGDQVSSAELIEALRSKDSRDPVTIRIIRCRDILARVSPRFSVGHVAHDLMKLLKACVTLPNHESKDAVRLMEILSERFSSSFRPGAKDIIGLIESSKQAEGDWMLGNLLKLLRMALRNQLGNPKNTFLTITDEFLPMIGDLPLGTLNISVIHDIIGTMFLSPANLECVYGYIRSLNMEETIPGETSGKKRRSIDSGASESYVSHLFLGVGSNVFAAKIVLSEFVGRRHKSCDHDDDFSMFSFLLKNLGLEGQIELWNHMASTLRIYRLRDEHCQKHQMALIELLKTVTDDSVEQRLSWLGLETVLAIDPWNLMDNVLAEIFKRLPSDSVECSSCLLTLFRTFAVKGSFSELVSKFLQLNDQSFSFLKDKRLINEISGVDLVDTLELLLKNTSGQSICEPLLEAAIGRIPDHLMPRACEVFSSSLSVCMNSFSEAKKWDRARIAIFMIRLVDALRIVSVSQSLPLQTNKDLELIEQSLELIARKCPSLRGASLIRLATLLHTQVSVSDILDCPGGAGHICDFIGSSFTNAFAVAHRLSSDAQWDSVRKEISHSLGSHVNMLKSFPEQLVSDSLFKRDQKDNSVLLGDDSNVIGSLLLKSKDMISRHGRLVFSPVPLRRSWFPEEVLALELAWANQAGNSEVVETLLKEAHNLEALYGLTVVIEELKRNKELHLGDGNLFEKLGSHPLVAQARLILALSGTQFVSDDMLVSISTDLLINDIRDRPAVDLAYYCLSQALTSGTDRRRIRIPWWANKMHVIVVAIRGLVGSCISGIDEETQKEASQYVARLWKIIADSVTSEKIFKISKSMATLAGEYIRLSGKICNGECASVLDRGCCQLLSKLTDEERNYLHALLGKTDRETLKRIVEMLERNYKYKGKV
jgi:hypothetical protein